MNYKVDHISDIIGAQWLQKGQQLFIEDILFDSRKISFPPASLFFAISGERRKGSEFIEDAYKKGVLNFVVDDSFHTDELIKYPNAGFLKVNNVLDALQSLAYFHRSQFHYPVIGITGSNGKTIVKEWLYHLLSPDYQIVRSPKSYNSQIGVPLSVWQMGTEDNLGIFEAGISLSGEMARLEKIIRPDIGVITFIGDAHAEGFNSLPEKIYEKLFLFSNSKVLIYPKDDALLHEAVTHFKQNKNCNLTTFSWGTHPDADVHVYKIEKQIASASICIRILQNDFHFFIPFSDDASIHNAITTCTVALYLKINPDIISNRLKEIRPVEMRLELKQGINQCDIINDSYSADLSSLRIALDFLSQQQQYAKKTVILSDFFQSGMPAESVYQKIVSLLTQKKINRFIGIGNEIMKHKDLFSPIEDVMFFLSTEDFINQFNALSFREESILLKGARLFQFEKISSLLEQKIHETVLEINLNALRSNLKKYQYALGQHVKIMAMVKAFSYGSGSFEIANMLQHEGVEYLAVAYTDEGVELRKAGIRLPIMVMNPTINSFHNLCKYQLEPEIFSFEVMDSFLHFLQQKNIKDYPVHLKLDTGMHRLGFLSSDIEQLCVLLHNQSSIQIKSVFSHLVASEDVSQDDFTLHQADLFMKMSESIEKAVGYVFLKHLSNTAAIRRHPGLQLDMVRLGIGLYGVDGINDLSNVTTLKTTIAQIKKIKKGETVGYGRKGKVNRDSVIATVRIGYADGYPRILGNGTGKMLIHDQAVPVIGNVCMDMTMLDITDIEAIVGDEVIVFGKNLSVKTIAEWAHTIPYEILTGISQRVKRIYYEE